MAKSSWEPPTRSGFSAFCLKASIREIAWEDLTDQFARDTGFNNLIDLMKTAKHGAGQRLLRAIPISQCPTGCAAMRVEIGFKRTYAGSVFSCSQASSSK